MFCLRDSARPTISPLVYIIKRYPEFWRQIRRLAGDEKFAELCRDYADAIEFYRYWRERSEPQALERARDYIKMVAELEAEILREIAADDHLTPQRQTTSPGGKS